MLYITVVMCLLSLYNLCMRSLVNHKVYEDTKSQYHILRKKLYWIGLSTSRSLKIYSKCFEGLRYLPTYEDGNFAWLHY